MDTLFDRADRIHHRKLWFFNGYLFRNLDWALRLFLPAVFFVSLGFWAVLGLDSTLEQVYSVSIDPLTGLMLPSFLTGIMQGKSFGEAWAYTRVMYGLGTHWSAFAIYSAYMWFVSWNLAKQGVSGSFNFGFSIGAACLAISFFEMPWMILYGFFQGQSWVYPWVIDWGAGTNIPRQNFIFLVGGLVIPSLGVGYYNASHSADRLCFRVDRNLILLFTLTFLGFWLWVCYPWTVKPFSVETVYGVWSNTRFFPQTTYTVNILGGIKGYAYYVADDLLHLVNITCKVIHTSMFLYALRLRKDTA